eukprot:CAMPEP_0119090744 /NCGR_PEP_ID=MMETSP1178-20130426/153873_1 /TAXON_ID=33656 /ORGANISM="unid sp, Strain CCMP2000" /LENGTH=69 /DNA_ID=CAMNT_0007074197 /DNA_START=80 /DNA_END=286 /DNA_ORIENTATION=-
MASACALAGLKNVGGIAAIALAPLSCACAASTLASPRHSAPTCAITEAGVASQASVSALRSPSESERDS